MKKNKFLQATCMVMAVVVTMGVAPSVALAYECDEHNYEAIMPHGPWPTNGVGGGETDKDDD